MIFMKLVREYINEKFAEDSDPIHDMGIGINCVRNFKSTKEIVDFLIAIMPYILHTRNSRRYNTGYLSFIKC